MTASPMNFSTVPPWRSSTLRATPKYRSITRRRDSESSRSPSAVDPVTSQKRIVTTLRSSRTSATASGAPQESQKRAPSRFSCPQAAQVVTRTAYEAAGSVPNGVG